MINNRTDFQVDCGFYWDIGLGEISFGMSGTGLTQEVSLKEGARAECLKLAC